MLSNDEISFLGRHGLTATDVYDGRNQTSAVWKKGARVGGLRVVLGTPCKKGGHRLRTRSGHCAQCDTSKLAYQTRYRTPGYVYIAGSLSGRLLKIGTAIDIEQRSRNLRHHAYGGVRDWAMLFSAKVEAGGEIERSALSKLKTKKVQLPYDKDGRRQQAHELLRATFSETLATLRSVLEGKKASAVWKSPKTDQYEFEL